MLHFFVTVNIATIAPMPTRKPKPAEYNSAIVQPPRKRFQYIVVLRLPKLTQFSHLPGAQYASALHLWLSQAARQAPGRIRLTRYKFTECLTISDSQ